MTLNGADNPYAGRRHDGEDRRALQAARLHLPVLGDLRRPRLDLRLRPLRRPAEEQRQGRVVAGRDPGARRHGRARRRDPDAPARVGGVRARRRASPTRSCSAWASARSAGAPTTSSPAEDGELRCPECGGELGEAREFNLMFETFMGPVREDAARDLPAPRDRAGHLRQLQERAPVLAHASRRSGSRRSARRSATRSRPATSSSARASSSRWRSSSSCRRPRRRSGTSAGWTTRMRWYTDLGIRPDHLQLREHGDDELSHYSAGDQRHRVPVPDGLVGAGGDREPHRLRPASRTPSSRARTSPTSTRRPSERYVPVRDRALRRRRPRRRSRSWSTPTTRRRSPGRKRTRAAAAPAPRAGEGRGAAARVARRACPRRRARSTRSCAA